MDDDGAFSHHVVSPMPVSYRIHAYRMDTIVQGRITVRDFRDHLAERSRDERVATGLYELLDATTVTNVVFSPLDIPHLVDCQRDHAELFHPIPLAIVATDPLIFGYARSFETLTGPSSRLIRVFATRREGEGWLDAVARTHAHSPSHPQALSRDARVIG